MSPTGSVPKPGRKITMERTYKADLVDVWDMWTTKEGIESWWGPDGFHVKVRSIDLRPGGVLKYAMIASGPDQIAFMKNAGMPTTTEAHITYTEVTPNTRLVYDHLTDFIPGVKPYNVATRVELFESPAGVRLVLTFDAMHAEEWTQRAAMGWEMELGKLAQALASSKKR